MIWQQVSFSPFFESELAPTRVDGFGRLTIAFNFQPLLAPSPLGAVSLFFVIGVASALPVVVVGEVRASGCSVNQTHFLGWSLGSVGSYCSESILERFCPL